MKPLQTVFLLMLVAVFVSGCGEAEPEFTTAVTGKITKNGTPVNKVEVRFVPLNEGTVKYVASGVSDDDGNFTISIPGRDDQVCCIGPCKVTIREAPLPGDIRGNLEKQDGRGGGAFMKYQNSLKNRPIPRDYERLTSTPLKFDVTEDKSEGYDIEL